MNLCALCVLCGLENMKDSRPAKPFARILIRARGKEK